MKYVVTKPRGLYPLGASLTLATLLVGAGVHPVAAQRSAVSPANTLVAAIDFQGGKSLDPAREFENLGNSVGKGDCDGAWTASQI